MKLVCGLGNPGPEYERTRHNVGFMVVDAFAEGLSASWTVKWNSRVARVFVEAEPVIVVEPMTFMNLSGESVAKAAGFYKVVPGDILAVHDDADLPLGRLKMTVGSGDGGHKGVRSIISCLGTRSFARLRVGIGRPSEERAGLTGHVLSGFDEDEAPIVDHAVSMAADGIRIWVADGVAAAQNRVNRRDRPGDFPSCPGLNATGPKGRKEVS